LAARLPDDAEALNAEAWQAVRRVGQPFPLYERAARQAQVAVANSPKDKTYLTTLGAAQYRLDAFSDATETLGRAESFKNEEDERTPSVGRFFRAMALKKMGQTQSAEITALAHWSQWLAPDSDAEQIFAEMNDTLFGPRAETARALVLRLFAAGKSATAVEAALNANAKLTREQRATAIGLIPVAQTYSAVLKEQKSLLLRSRVTEALEHSTNLTTDQRQMALALAEQTKEDAEELNDASWAVVSRPGLSGDEYQLALAQAEAAYRHSPNDAIRNTLGVAQFRVGKYEEAIGTLSESERASTEGIAAPGDLPFLAMAFQKAGKLAEAKKRFDQLANSLAKNPTRNPEMLACLHEVEAVFGLKLKNGSQSQSSLHRCHHRNPNFQVHLFSPLSHEIYPEPSLVLTLLVLSSIV
jgi:Flp pilus assembly protein TadD